MCECLLFGVSPLLLDSHFLAIPAEGMQRGRTVEASFIRNVVYQQDTHGTSVVRGGDGPEALLAGGIPYLQLHALAVELDGADFEVDADGSDERGRERVFAETQ
jgi:hypothetical protein